MTNNQQAELEQYRKAAREYHESVERRLANHERSIECLERRADAQADMIADLDEKKHYSQPVLTSSSRCIVTEAQVERWERIEREALAIVPYLERIPVTEERDFDVMQALLDAFKR